MQNFQQPLLRLLAVETRKQKWKATSVSDQVSTLVARPDKKFYIKLGYMMVEIVPNFYGSNRCILVC